MSASRKCLISCILLRISPSYSIFGSSSFNQLSTPETLGRRRKKRTSIETNVRVSLERAFIANPKPTSEEITALANNLCMEKEVVRVWYCNRRQKEKRVNPSESDSPDSLGSSAGGLFGFSSLSPHFSPSSIKMEWHDSQWSNYSPNNTDMPNDLTMTSSTSSSLLHQQHPYYFK